MASPAALGVEAAAPPADAPRHGAVVRLTHWLIVLACAALLLSGIEILLSHPRFYWGETGNVNEAPLFVIPVPSSRSAVATGYGFVLGDANGWSRSLHFEAAWLAVFTGLVYLAAGLRSRHFRSSLVPARRDLNWRAIGVVAAKSLRPGRAGADTGAHAYNVLQRLTYLGVVFVLAPFLVWTGLAMSDALAARWPAMVTLLGGRQSARTLHFAATALLVLFVMVHVLMVIRAGFAARVRAMITGRVDSDDADQPDESGESDAPDRRDR